MIVENGPNCKVVAGTLKGVAVVGGVFVAVETGGMFPNGAVVDVEAGTLKGDVIDGAV